jgi:hypothetical protein
MAHRQLLPFDRRPVDAVGTPDRLFDDLPDEGWRQDDAVPRFVQFAFLPKWFCMDLPRQTLARAEAEIILRDLSGFFFLKDRPEFRLDRNEPVEGYDPFRKIYVYGDEATAAGDTARIFFDVWKFPVDWRFFVTASAFSGKARFESDTPIE